MVLDTELLVCENALIRAQIVSFCCKSKQWNWMTERKLAAVNDKFLSNAADILKLRWSGMIKGVQYSIEKLAAVGLCGGRYELGGLHEVRN